MTWPWLLTVVIVAAPLAWWVVRDRGWMWLPVALTALLSPFTQRLGELLYPILVKTGWLGVIALLAVGLGALYGGSRLQPLTARVALGGIVIPLLVLTTLYGIVTSFIGSIG